MILWGRVLYGRVSSSVYAPIPFVEFSFGFLMENFDLGMPFCEDEVVLEYLF